MTPHEQAAEDLAGAARRLADEGLLVGTAGNLSMRVPQTDDLVVTGTGVVLADCDPEDVVPVDAVGAVLSGTGRPTSELALHLGVYADTDATAVVHTHAPYSTALACVLDELPVIHYQQLLLGGAVRVAPYATFGTPELADAVRVALVDRRAALMASHGAVAIGGSLGEAVDHALLLEWLATLYHRARAFGEPRVLTEDDQAAVLRAALERGYGSTQEDR